MVWRKKGMARLFRAPAVFLHLPLPQLLSGMTSILLGFCIGMFLWIVWLREPFERWLSRPRKLSPQERAAESAMWEQYATVMAMGVAARMRAAAVELELRLHRDKLKQEALIRVMNFQMESLRAQSAMRIHEIKKIGSPQA